MVAVQQAVAGEPAQHAAAYLHFDRSHRFWRPCRGRPELYPAGFERVEHAPEDAAVGVEVAIERGAEAVHEAPRPKARLRRGPRAACSQTGLDHPQEDMQPGSVRLWLPLQVATRPLGHREHPLPHRQERALHDRQTPPICGAHEYTERGDQLVGRPEFARSQLGWRHRVEDVKPLHHINAQMVFRGLNTLMTEP